MIKEGEMIESNLGKYPLMKGLLGDIVKKRLGLKCYTYGALTANLLESDSELTKCDLEKLEIVLQFGSSCCKDFQLIFQGVNLSQEDADAKILDMLAEVKAFEFLCRHGFEDITRVNRQQGLKTVDFTAKRNSHNYAVEVTRLGLAQSDKKQPRYAYKEGTIDRTVECEAADGYEISMITKGQNIERLENEINDAIGHKYPQIIEFCERQNDTLRGILFISDGRSYFAAGKYENKDYEQTHQEDFANALQRVWQSLKTERRDTYLHHLVIARGKDLAKAIVYPIFEGSNA